MNTEQILAPVTPRSSLHLLGAAVVLYFAAWSSLGCSDSGSSPNTNPDLATPPPAPIRLSSSSGAGSSIAAGASTWGVAWVEDFHATFQQVDSSGQLMGSARMGLPASIVSVAAAPSSDRFGVALVRGAQHVIGLTTNDMFSQGLCYNLPIIVGASTTPQVDIVAIGTKWAVVASQYDLRIGSYFTLVLFDGQMSMVKDLAIGDALMSTPIHLAHDGTSLWLGWTTSMGAKLRRMSPTGEPMGSDIALTASGRWFLSALVHGGGEVAAFYGTESGLAMRRFDGSGASIGSEEMLATPAGTGIVGATAASGAYAGVWWTTSGELAVGEWTPEGQARGSIAHVATSGAFAYDLSLALLVGNFGVASSWSSAAGPLEVYFVRVPSSPSLYLPDP